MFEAHLAYCITVWGGASKSLINSLFITQKRIVRYVFGDAEAFMNKFCTAARTRSIDKQILSQDFCRKEGTKPLFHKNKLLTVHNLYKYMCANEISKIITTKFPTVLSNSIALSNRNDKNIYYHFIKSSYSKQPISSYVIIFLELFRKEAKNP